MIDWFALWTHYRNQVVEGHEPDTLPEWEPGVRNNALSTAELFAIIGSDDE